MHNASIQKGHVVLKYDPTLQGAGEKCNPFQRPVLQWTNGAHCRPSRLRRQLFTVLFIDAGQFDVMRMAYNVAAAAPSNLSAWRRYLSVCRVDCVSGRPCMCNVHQDGRYYLMYGDTTMYHGVVSISGVTYGRTRRMHHARIVPYMYDTLQSIKTSYVPAHTQTHTRAHACNRWPWPKPVSRRRLSDAGDGSFPFIINIIIIIIIIGVAGVVAHVSTNADRRSVPS